jgi:uncharacterized protein YoxC
MNEKNSNAMENNDKKAENIVFKKEGGDSSSLAFLAAFIVILVIVSVIAYKSGVDVKQLQADVAAFKTNLQARYAKAGKTISFDYKDVTAEGGILSKTIKIDSPSITMGEGAETYQVSAAAMHIVPDDAYYKEFDAQLFSPVVIKDESGSYTYSAEKPLPVKVTTSEEGLREYVISLPTVSKIDANNRSGASQYTLTAQEASVVKGAFSDKAVDIYMVDIDLNKVTFASDVKTSTATHLGYTLDIEAGVENEDINVEALVSDYVPAELTPVSIDIAQQVTHNPQTGAMAFNIKQFIADHASYDLDVEGDFNIVKDQILPLANVGVTLKGADYVLSSVNNSQIVPSSVTNVIGSVLNKIAPEWNKTTNDVLSFKIHRTEDAPFMVGAVKADELFAIALKEWYVNKNAIPFSGTEAGATNPVILDNTTTPAGAAPADTAVDLIPNVKEQGAEIIDAIEQKSDAAIDAVTPDVDAITEEAEDLFDKAKEATEEVLTPDADVITPSQSSVNEAKEAVSKAQEALSDMEKAVINSVPQQHVAPIEPKVIKVPSAQ